MIGDLHGVALLAEAKEHHDRCAVGPYEPQHRRDVEEDPPVLHRSRHPPAHGRGFYPAPLSAPVWKRRPAAFRWTRGGRMLKDCARPDGTRRIATTRSPPCSTNP